MFKSIVFNPIVALTLLGLACSSHAEGQFKISLGQFRIVEAEQQSYWLNSVNAQYKSDDFKFQLSQPMVKNDDAQGLANGVFKATLLRKVGKTYVDIHLRQKLGNADDKITLATKDTGLSIEVSHIAFGAIGFIETGYWWRAATEYERENTFFYVVGLAKPISKSWLLGSFMDYKPTAYGELDKSLSGFARYKLNSKNKLTLLFGKGLEENSPDWIAGLQWSHSLATNR